LWLIIIQNIDSTAAQVKKSANILEKLLFRSLYCWWSAKLPKVVKPIIDREVTNADIRQVAWSDRGESNDGTRRAPGA